MQPLAVKCPVSIGHESIWRIKVLQWSFIWGRDPAAEEF